MFVCIYEYIICCKENVYKGLVLAILLYGEEHWCLTAQLYDKMSVFHSRFSSNVSC